MNIARHHADWLSLIEVSGPFISLPVLVRTFPQGLEPRDALQAKMLRAAYEEWRDNPTVPGKHHTWIMHVLTSGLGYPESQIAEAQALPAGLEANMPEMRETLRPDFALIGPEGTATAAQPQLLIVSYPAAQCLDKPVIGKHWKATPATRMMELLRAVNVPLGLVTNGEHWMLVYALRGETTGYSSWYSALWLDEPVTLRAFRSLVGVRRFFGVTPDSTLLALFKESASDQQEVTDQLGYQVREAVEVLVQSFDTLDRESRRECLTSIPPAAVYDAALTVMMRLVFLFSAEERGLLHLGTPLYDDNYAVSTLQEQLQDVADRYGEEVLERRYDAWARLLSTFRAVHGGIQHQDLLMQAYGGSLFDPDRYPFLEGRVAGSHWRSTQAEPLAVNSRVVLHLLNSLQRLRTKQGGGMAETRRVSFRALGVEQIGHVYEGLLDHTAMRATEVVLGIRGTRSKEPEIALSKLEALLAHGEVPLLEHLKEQTGRSLPALRKEFESGEILDGHTLLLACNQDEALAVRLRRFAGLIREDSFERPWVVLPGSLFVTEGTTRRSTGTHYTPPSLTEPIVQYTLEPLVYVGPAEGLPKEQWTLKLPREILDLKVCDMAMGSGAFLVQACRYLAERLVEAWENEEKDHPGHVLITPDGRFSEGSPRERLMPAEAAERIAIARRVVADRCLYGVDINPMAVEMAKLSMWLITVDANRPFTFLDHAFKCGDSLLGITSLEQLENFSLRPGGGKQQIFATLNLWRHIQEAKKKREALEAVPSDTPEQVAAKAALYAEAEDAVAKLHAAADVLLTVELKGLKGKAYEAERELVVECMMGYWAQGRTELQDYARERLGKRHGFHWALAYPEIMERNGFDAFIGNPPFLYGTLAATAFGTDYMALLQQCSPPWHGKADLVVGFYKRAATLLRASGRFSFIATASILRGESLDSSIRDLRAGGWILYCARSAFKWPGTANLEVVATSFGKNWEAKCLLDGQTVDAIDDELKPGDPIETQPYELVSGTPYAGLGIKLSPANREIPYDTYLAEREEFPALREFLVPAIGGENLYDLLDLNRAPHAISPEKLRDFILSAPQLHNIGYVCLGKPGKYAHSAPAAAISKAISTCRHAFACGETSSVLRFAPVPKTDCILKHKLIIFPTNEFGLFAVLQSDIHSAWAWRWGLRRKRDLVYSPKRCASTFPLTQNLSILNDISEGYLAHRQSILQLRQEGLTKTYNRFHDPQENTVDIVRLRRLHTEMNNAVAAAYGWSDLDLGHGFHETMQGVRFTIAEAARREVLDRLLKLNHRHHAEEVAAAAAQEPVKPAKRGRNKKDAGSQTTLDF